MAVATGTSIRPELSAVDYTPFLQAAGQAAQMQVAGAGAIGAGITSVGKSIAEAAQEYQKNKLANETLEGENASMLKILASTPEYKDFAPDIATIDKYSQKLIRGGLSLGENKKLNAELNATFKIGDNVIRARQQQLYAKVAEENAKTAAIDRVRKEQENKAIDAFNTELSGISNPSADDIYNIGAKNKTPPQYVNAALNGKIDINRYNMAVKSFETEQIASELKIRAAELDLDKMQALAKRVQELGGKGDIKASVVNGATVFELTTPEGKTSFEVLRPPAAPKPTPTEGLSGAVSQYIEAEDKNDPVLRDAAIAVYSKVMGFQGPGFTKEAVEGPLKQLADETRKARGGAGGATMAAPANAAGVKTITRVQGAPPSQAPQQPAATPAQTSNVQPVRVETRTVAQNNLPPKLPTASTEQLGASGNAELQAFLASRAAASPAVSDTQLTQAVIAAAPQAPIVDTNLEPSRLAYIPRSPAGAPQYGTMYQEAGFNYPAASVLGAAERVAGALGPVSQQIQVPGRLLNELGRYGSAALTGVVTGDYTVPNQGIVDIGAENIAQYLSQPNAVGESVRTIASRAGMVPEGVGEAVFDRPSNAIQATMEALSSGMRPGGGRQQTTEAAAPRPMQSAEIPQIELSKDAKRIADLLLQEYENTKGGKPPTFTITASRPGGGETTVKLRNPEILAIMSNPTNFGGLIRGNVNQFQQQNAQMNRILEQMLAERQATLAARRANRAR